MKIMCLIGLVWATAIVQPSNLWLSYTASFGRQGADCAGRGICSFVENKENGNVRLGYSPTDSVMTMQIIQNKIEPKTLEKQITPEPSTATSAAVALFEMESEYILPQVVKEQLRIPQGLQRIPKGKYKTTDLDGLTIVQFKIK